MRLLTIKETAEILKVTPHWLYKLAREGCFPTVRLGRAVRVDEAALRILVGKPRRVVVQRVGNPWGSGGYKEAVVRAGGRT
jgi:excisionase family DNA binding protein